MGRFTTFSGVGGWVGGVEEWRIKPSQLSTKLKLKLKLKLSLAKETLIM